MSSYQFRQSLSYVNVVPNFLKGYVKERGGEGEEEEEGRGGMYLGEEARLSDKKRKLVLEEEQEEQEDELPSIAVLQEGDLSEEEVLRLRKAGAKSFLLFPPPFPPSLLPSSLFPLPSFPLLLLLPSNSFLLSFP